MSGLSLLRQKVNQEDDIEYNITFPTSTYTNTDHEPVVFLLGWLGCKDKTLAKYSKMYENEGCITIRYIHPVHHLFSEDPSDSKVHRETAKKLTSLLDDYELKQHPIVVHSFSNGGYFIYSYLADQFVTSNINMLGVILDSSPAKLRLLPTTRAILSPGVFPNKFLTFLAFLMLSFSFFILTIKRISGLSRKQNLYEHMKQSEDHCWSHLFLYSTEDQIVDSEDILEMYNSRLAFKSSVSKYDFKTSAHVSHYLKFSGVYQSKCFQFIERCTQTYNPDPSQNNKAS